MTESPKLKRGPSINLLGDEKSGIKLLFEKYDTNKDGKIDQQEMDGLLREVYDRAGIILTPEISQTIWTVFDSDKSKEVDWAEFEFVVEKYSSALVKGQKQD